MNKELKFLEIINKKLDDNSFLGDDCAYLKDLNLAISADTLVEDVHFKLSMTSPYLLAKKALKVNISDILASGAIPKYATIAISGKLDENFINKFYEGINSVADEYNIKIIGGDLTGGEKLTISITILGDTKSANVSSRKNAKAGYVVAVCGEFGTSAKGFKLLQKNPKEENYFVKAHLDPILNKNASNALSRCALPYAAMDSSDGLYNALFWIAKASNVGFEIEYEKIPKRPEVDKSDVLFGGEDYSLVCVLSKKDYENLASDDFKIIGKATDNCGIFLDGVNFETFENKEFLHFD